MIPLSTTPFTKHLVIHKSNRKTSLFLLIHLTSLPQSTRLSINTFLLTCPITKPHHIHAPVHPSSLSLSTISSSHLTISTSLITNSSNCSLSLHQAYIECLSATTAPPHLLATEEGSWPTQDLKLSILSTFSSFLQMLMMVSQETCTDENTDTTKLGRHYRYWYWYQ